MIFVFDRNVYTVKLYQCEHICWAHHIRWSKCDYMQSKRHVCLCHYTISMTAAGEYRSIAWYRQIKGSSQYCPTITHSTKRLEAVDSSQHCGIYRLTFTSWTVEKYFTRPRHEPPILPEVFNSWEFTYFAHRICPFIFIIYTLMLPQNPHMLKVMRHDLDLEWVLYVWLISLESKAPKISYHKLLGKQ